jgi:glyoxylase-like metal-dependent hydrolase (beta-lactamase superfamily II)
VFTHAHGDHYGLAGPVRQRSGSWIALHAADVPLVESQLRGQRDGDDFAVWLERAGVPDGVEQQTMRPGRGHFVWHFPPVLPDRELADGQRIDAAGWELDVLHTPGHTPGHVALVERRAGVVLTGDAVLGRITPNISATPHAEDPLGDYIAALQRLRDLGDLTGLPGHEPRVASVAARAAEILEHHEEQLRETLGLVDTGAETVRDVAERMPWSRPWSALPGYERRAALGEAQAHLVVLEQRGAVTRVGEQPLRWRRPVAA